MAHPYWQSKYQGSYYDQETRKTVQAAGPVTKSFARAGEMFAQRHKAAGGGAAQAVTAQVRERWERRDWAGAMSGLVPLLKASPDDLTLLKYRADCLVGLQDWAGAREECTRILTVEPTWAAGYLQRAVAAAYLQAPARARADVAVARGLGAAQAEAVRERVEAILAALSSAADPAPLVARLEEAAGQDTAWPKLVEDAVALHRAVNTRRLRYDETYQDRLRVLDAAWRAEPRNPDRMAALARFLMEEFDSPQERVEPRGPVIQYRYQTAESLNRDVQRALALVDGALRLRPDHVPALSVKAGILCSRFRFEEAQPILDRLVQLKTDDPEVLRLMALSLDAAADRCVQKANGLLSAYEISRTPLGDGTERVVYHVPSDAERAEADRLKREARRLRALADAYMEKCIAQAGETAEGYFYRGLLDRSKAQPEQARKNLEQAVRMKSDYTMAWYVLALVYGELRLEDLAAEARSNALNLIQTTASAWLTNAWSKIAQTKWKTGREAAARARSLDPADARTQAYLGGVDLAQDAFPQALAHFRCALALEEARLRLHGRALAGKNALPLDPPDVGLPLALRIRLGAVLLAQGRTEAAAETFKANADFLAPFAFPEQFTDLPTSMLPYPTGNPAAALSDTYALLRIRSQAGLDYCAWARRYREAQDVALAAKHYRRFLVDFAIDTPKLDVLQANAALGLAELEVAKRNFARADELLVNRGAVSQAFWQEMRQVQTQINQGRSQDAQK